MRSFIGRSLRSFVLTIALFCVSSGRAYATPFDIIVPTEVEIRTYGLGIYTGFWGLVVGTSDTISVADLESALFDVSFAFDGVSSISQDFVSESSVGPIGLGEYGGEIRTGFNTVLGDYLQPGESSVNPPDTEFFVFDSDYNTGFIGSGLLTVTLMLGADAVTYQTILNYVGAQGRAGMSFLGAQRLSSTPTNEIPEPATIAMLGMGMLAAGLRRRTKTRNYTRST